MFKVLTTILATVLVATSVCNAEDDYFDIAVVQDLHADLGSTTKTIATNLVPFILANTNSSLFRFKLFISGGDLYEQITNGILALSTNMWTTAEMVMAMNQLRTNGIVVNLSNGNHDSDLTNSSAEIIACLLEGTPDANALTWNVTWGTNNFFSSQLGYIGTRIAGDYRNVAMTYTNGIKLLLLTYQDLVTNCAPQAGYQIQTDWVTNMMATYPDHYTIVIGHQIINSFLTIGYIDGPTVIGNGSLRVGPGSAPYSGGFLDWPNALASVSGHDRRLRKVFRPVAARDGHTVLAIGFNTQGATNANAFINVLRFYNKTKKMQTFTYNYIEGYFLTNNDTRLLSGAGTPEIHNYSINLPGTRRMAIFR